MTLLGVFGSISMEILEGLLSSIDVRNYYTLKSSEM